MNAIAQRLVDSEKHLKLIGGGWEFQLFDLTLSLKNDMFVMRGDSHVDTGPQQTLE